MIGAELYKARRTRSTWWLGAIAAVFSAGWAVVNTLVWMTPTDTGVENTYSMASQGYLFAMIAGVLLVAGEYRHKTITWAALVCPARGRVLASKLAACAVLGVLIGLLAALLTAAASVVALAATGQPVYTPDVPLALLGSVLGTGLWTVFGGALGALVPNQFAAVAAAFAWFYYAEWLLVSLVPTVGRWTPTGAAKAVSGWTRDAMPVSGALLPMWAGGLLFLVYTGAAAALALATTARRDIS